MAWETVKIGEKQLGRNIPTISVGRKRLALSKSACALIDQEKEKFQYVQFYLDKDNPTAVAMRFWKDPRNDNCVPLKQKKIDGKDVGGLEVANANLLKTIFGPVAEKEGTTHYRVHMDRTDKYLMVIDLE